ncbi:MAG: hypothetical protein UX08_C0020G0007 [Candidatus Collierbacteria bacterium GW2011_GWB1_45_35]|uniref:Tetratricopeptide repeat protein n=1 Tax=Candidatus Collierbacteria bacterium GW2011_GWB2_45_17 TaxID=1618388 RepID=A0A837IG42_9BACT|nr:MAG: hypothetical protein UW48_C0013G0015 [Microgenomates group bacterium GW2011_GWC1_44_23]KKT94998.1 MAG: hypothetical protein UW96_C0012G0015 [Candidatus Collierbacteria bacterium GW2011_GWA1_45_15]KKT99017.1 MAG: hypothetical protein UX01_C0014G0007 [Candidatus Collierbacteria bacterium GW2011_GWB2_45_17]KKU04631.1 MAG: hypothetical protein UX08_C0020G0007 [Candidatus Collierbacteria bacterium GW2011_GWB1_45_35]KKU07290.1 MAG: hypothetical protein UX11_C0017G0007 [Candidatus Collierbacte
MEKLSSVTCSWCGHKGVPGDGNGVFRDVDVDFNTLSYPGIPICGGCGGLGVEYEVEDFKARTSRICDLRFKFHPVDDLQEPPTVIPYVALRELIKEVEELVKYYGPASENSFSSRLLAPDSVYRRALSVMEKGVNETLERVKNYTPDIPRATISRCREALIALYSGEIDKGFRLYERLLKDFPTHSGLEHDYGTLLIMFKRDMPNALLHFQKSTTLEPKKALHFFQTAKALVLLKRPVDALVYAIEAKEQPDYPQVQAENDDIESLLTELSHLVPQTNNRVH